ncbi:MAG: archaeosortase/exosortase family protein [Sedimentisphaerales bacterium]|nr:archaeosortase/exosortase family protein [Sedimentisphaerales bacterium]
MQDRLEPAKVDVGPALARLIVLLCLSLWVFWPQIVGLALTSHKSSETAHVLVVPLAVLLLVYLRRSELAASLTTGSVWGLVFLAVGMVLHVLAIWPFPYGYAHYVAIISTLTGVILISCGWRFLKLSLPMLLLLWLAFPIGSRIHATLVLRPNTYTVAAVAAALDQFPDIDTSIDGADLLFTSGRGRGAVGLGESNRGARLLFAFAAIGIFVGFSRVRRPWQVFAVVAAAVPVILLCNFLRFFCWALLVIYGTVGPDSSLPRNVSTICTLLVCYGLFAVLSAARFNLFIEERTVNEGSADVQG